MHPHEQLMEDFANVIIPQSHVLVKSSFFALYKLQKNEINTFFI